MIKYSKQAIKFLKKQPRNQRSKIVEAIQNIPYGDIKKLKGLPFYRLRVGDYRVFFNQDKEVTFVEKIGNRGDVYK